MKYLLQWGQAKVRKLKRDATVSSVVDASHRYILLSQHTFLEIPRFTRILILMRK
jgi:hypothetical protein